MARSAAGFLSRPIAALRARLAGRPDTEHEQALVRIGMYVVMGLYMLPELSDRIDLRPDEPHVIVGIGYFAAALALFAAIVANPIASPSRRLIGMAMDITMLTWCMVFFDDRAVPFVLVYVWVTLANGFRFGPGALTVCLALSVLGFGTVLVLSEFWRGYPTAGIGLLIALAMLSLCLAVILGTAG